MSVPNNVQVFGVVAFYMSAALVMVFVNKAVLSNSPDLPLLFLWVQLIIAVVLLHASAAVTKRIEIPVLDWNVAKKLFPVVLVNIVGLVIARGLQLPLTILISSYSTHSLPSVKTIVATVAVSLGFFIGVVPSQSTPSVISLIYGVLSSLMIAIHAVLIKSSLPHCRNSTIQLAWWTNAGSAVLLAPFVVFNGELSVLHAKIADSNWNGMFFAYASILTGAVGFLLCVAGLLSIKVTSPVTHMFSSAARSVLQTLLGVWIFNDMLNTNRVSSILTILGGTMYYTWVKSSEVKPPPSQPAHDLESMGQKENEVSWSADKDGER
ncbi:hypothetical protein D9757_004679 [Collybiopsis confluens]|uniref:GDP-mannose transporter n=1 Tax=Collybiopsis confluens TaxID=2823264 RepID=A0A8H5HS62_9AGAR|nr:hypothetical protein D9757_004679 [Collybiopsis confluens]